MGFLGDEVAGVFINHVDETTSEADTLQQTITFQPQNLLH